MIGALGEYEFEVSDYGVRTFRDARFSNSVNYAEHKVLGRKALLEFTGVNASSCSMTIELNSFLGVDVAEEISALYELMTEGTALVFTLGGEVMGEDMWVIESLEESYEEVSGSGEIKRAKLELRLKEYISEE